MQRNDQAFYDTYAQSAWDKPQRFERMLASQVFPRLEYFDTVAMPPRTISVAPAQK